MILGDVFGEVAGYCLVMRLDPCPSSPNCISSQADASDGQHYMEAVDISSSPGSVLDAVESVLGDAGAKVTKRTEDRVEAIFTTRIFRFKDDVTFAVDAEANKLHFRSASRVGSSDLGANKKRLRTLLPLIQAKL